MRSKPLERKYAEISRGRTPGSIRGDSITQEDLALCQWVHSRALLGLQEKENTEGQNYKGIVLGHTHLPLLQECPELPFLLNGGDMRHSSSFVVKDDAALHLMQWNPSQNQWLVTSSQKL